MTLVFLLGVRRRVGTGKRISGGIMNLFLRNGLLHTKIVNTLQCLDLTWCVDRASVNAGGRRLRLGNSC